MGSRPFARTFAKKAPVPFHYEPVFQDAVEDDTQYRCLTTDYVSTIEVDGKTVLKVDPEGLRLLSKTAMNDISHLLRPAHLKQLASILDDPEASANDRFVALELLKAVWCAGPGPQKSCGLPLRLALKTAQGPRGLPAASATTPAVCASINTRAACSTDSTDHSAAFGKVAAPLSVAAVAAAAAALLAFLGS